MRTATTVMGRASARLELRSRRARPGCEPLENRALLSLSGTFVHSLQAPITPPFLPPVATSVARPAIGGTIRSVSFGGPGNIIITPDPTPEPANRGLPFEAPDWLGNNVSGPIGPSNNRQFPVAYVRNSRPRISATVVLTADPPRHTSVMIEGIGPSNIDIPPTRATIEGCKATITNIAATAPLPNSIARFPSFTINWKISVDGGRTWKSAGSTSNPMYVTLARPVGSDRNLTLFALASLHSGGDTTATQTIANVWQDFTSRDIRNAEGTPLRYYGTYTTQTTTTQGLIARGNGQCGSFAHLFIDVLKVEGIHQKDNYVVAYYAKHLQDGGFLVKNWNFGTAGTSGNPEYPYVNVLRGWAPEQHSYPWLHAEVTQGYGIPGQNNDSPASLFGNHQMVLMGNTLYDPSYGVAYTDPANVMYPNLKARLDPLLRQMESTSIAGYFVGEYNKNLHMTYYYIKKNDGSGELDPRVYTE